jgi:hypothetical protein
VSTANLCENSADNELCVPLRETCVISAAIPDRIMNYRCHQAIRWQEEGNFFGIFQYIHFQ